MASGMKLIQFKTSIATRAQSAACPAGRRDAKHTEKKKKKKDGCEFTGGGGWVNPHMYIYIYAYININLSISTYQ